jgi:hypothetical protein
MDKEFKSKIEGAIEWAKKLLKYNTDYENKVTAKNFEFILTQLTRIKKGELVDEEHMHAMLKRKREVDREKIARLMHDTYEKQAKIAGWKTQESCQVLFDELPEANKKVMYAVAEAIISEINS